MFNLLTEEAKERISREYNKRRIVVILGAVSLISIVGIVGLLPSYLLSNNRESEAQERVKILESTGHTKNKAELEAWLTKINLELETLSPKLDTDRPSEFIENILDEKSSSIRITGFSWVKENDKTMLAIEGVALDRQTLINFGNRIKESKKFSEVTLPISNLAQDKNINFQIKFSP